MSKDPCLQCEPIYIDPDIQDRTLSLLIKLPLFKLESELPLIIPIIRKRCVRGVSMTQQRPGDPVLLPTRHFSPGCRMASTTRGIHAAGNHTNMESTQQPAPNNVSKRKSDSCLRSQPFCSAEEDNCWGNLLPSAETAVEQACLSAQPCLQGPRFFLLSTAGTPAV